MKIEKHLSLIAIIISVILIAVAVYFAAKFFLGPDGFIKRYREVDTEYNKSEVVEELNYIVKEKYFNDSKYAQENNKNIDDFYNVDYVLNYLKEKEYIQVLRDIKDNDVQDQYYINTEHLNRDIAAYEVKPNGSAGNGTKVFKIKKEEEVYNIYFVDAYGEEEKLGELIFKPEMK